MLCLVRGDESAEVLNTIGKDLKSQYPSDLRRSYQKLPRSDDSASADPGPTESVARLRGKRSTVRGRSGRAPEHRPGG